jgi:glycerol-3-phosphate dehydrogenase
LTTFLLMVLEALQAVDARLPRRSLPASTPNPGHDNETNLAQVAGATARRLQGRYGTDAGNLIALAHSGELAAIPGTEILWAELRWAAHNEGVVHLDDLLLRRVRLGLLLPEGAKAHLPAIRSLCQLELGWTDERWEQEENAYLALIHKSYSLPDRSTIPDWHLLLKAVP